MEVMKSLRWILAIFSAWTGTMAAQPAGGASVVGTVVAVRAEAGSLDLKRDEGPVVTALFDAETAIRRVAPGEKDLKRAEAILASDIAAGDRVLVSFKPGTAEALRIVVMPTAAIARRNESDRLDWTERGVSGIVSSAGANRITLRMRSFQGEARATVTVDDKTVFRRYAPDSVKFSDARPSSLAEVAASDQLRARGRKRGDETAVHAEEVVFGTFVTKAGVIQAVNPETNEIAITELGTNKRLTVAVTGDSQLKELPDFSGMSGGPGLSGSPGGMTGPPGAAAGGALRGMPDFSQMIERLPATRIGNLKPGQTILVSSTKGVESDRVTAIMLLANAGMLIRMASTEPGRPGMIWGTGGGSPMDAGGMMGGIAGIELPGMIP
jgi:hypothetical protein